MPEQNPVELSFTCDFDERTEWETPQKGWFDQVLVHLPNGDTVHVGFWDPVRLSQDLERTLKAGGRCIGEPGIIIVPEVTVENMKAAVQELYDTGYFDRLRSLFV